MKRRTFINATAATILVFGTGLGKSRVEAAGSGGGGGNNCQPCARACGANWGPGPPGNGAPQPDPQTGCYNLCFKYPVPAIAAPTTKNGCFT